MNRCEHKTEEEYGLCNRCRAFERIARDARKLLQVRRTYLDALLVPSAPRDEMQEALSEATKRLEESVKFAEDHKLWD